MHPLIVKLGGSAITDKSHKCTPNVHVIQNAIDQLAKAEGPLILLHGGGSFAHPFVTQVGLHLGYRGRFQLRAISETELYLDQLTRIIGTSLMLRKRPFAALSPMSFILLRNGRISRAFLGPIERALDLGMIPLIHGDIVFDTAKRWGVLSADKLASFLGVRLGASRVLFGCDVDGVYTQDPKASEAAQLLEIIARKDYDSVLKTLARNDGEDATGGMFGKVVEAMRLAKNGVECVILSLKREGALGDAMRGRFRRGTRFVPWSGRA